jgi:hypothetical protein
MASGIYTASIGSFLRADIDLINKPVSVALVSAGYAPNLATDVSLADVPEAAIIRESLLINKTIDASNIFRADSVTFVSVAASPVDIVAAIVFVDDSTLENNKLIAYLDNATVFPITPDGTDITINWDPTDGIFKWLSL